MTQSGGFARLLLGVMDWNKTPVFLIRVFLQKDFFYYKKTETGFRSFILFKYYQHSLYRGEM